MLALSDDDDFWISLRNKRCLYRHNSAGIRHSFACSGVLASHTWQRLFNADYGQTVNYFLWQIGISRTPLAQRSALVARGGGDRHDLEEFLGFKIDHPSDGFARCASVLLRCCQA